LNWHPLGLGTDYVPLDQLPEDWSSFSACPDDDNMTKEGDKKILIEIK